MSRLATIAIFSLALSQSVTAASDGTFNTVYFGAFYSSAWQRTGNTGTLYREWNISQNPNILDYFLARWDNNGNTIPNVSHGSAYVPLTALPEDYSVYFDTNISVELRGSTLDFGIKPNINPTDHWISYNDGNREGYILTYTSRARDFLATRSGSSFIGSVTPTESEASYGCWVVNGGGGFFQLYAIRDTDSPSGGALNLKDIYQFWADHSGIVDYNTYYASSTLISGEVYATKGEYRVSNVKAPLAGEDMIFPAHPPTTVSAQGSLDLTVYYYSSTTRDLIATLYDSSNQIKGTSRIENKTGSGYLHIPLFYSGLGTNATVKLGILPDNETINQALDMHTITLTFNGQPPPTQTTPPSAPSGISVQKTLN